MKNEDGGVELVWNGHFMCLFLAWCGPRGKNPLLRLTKFNLSPERSMKNNDILGVTNKIIIE